MLRVRACLRVDADDGQAVRCPGDRNLGALQQELPVQDPFEPAENSRAFPWRLPVPRELGFQDPLTDQDVKALPSFRSLSCHDDHSALMDDAGKLSPIQRDVCPADVEAVVTLRKVL